MISAEYNEVTACKKMAYKVFRILRNASRNRECDIQNCQKCSSPHLFRIEKLIKKNKPLEFILPAFPAKSPNREKTLGSLPDKAEEIAIAYLADLNKKIKSVYMPGASIMIASDGNVFSDVVNLAENDVNEYSNKLRELIVKENFGEFFSFHDLNDALGGICVDKKRAKLISKYGMDIHQIKQEIKNSESTRNLFNGLHRFIFEDLINLHKTRSKARLEAKHKAYLLYQRSNAWSQYLKKAFPGKIRLSIHPHHPHSGKLGIKLNPADKGWSTPWHRVAIKTPDGFRLIRNDMAEKIGARLVYKNNRPYYYEFT